MPEWPKAAKKPTYTAAEVGALSADTLQTATEAALAQAKASGEFDGKDGNTGPQAPKATPAPGAPPSHPGEGTDYWTAADKAEIVADVLAALPDGTEVSY